MEMLESKRTVAGSENRLEQVLWTFSGIQVGHVRGLGGPGSSAFKGETELVRLHFNLSGGYDFDHAQLGKTYRVEGRQHNLMYSSEFDMVVHRRSQEVETFGVQIEKEAFLAMASEGTEGMKRLAEVVARNESTMAGENWGGNDPAVFGAIQDILNCRMEGRMKALLIESKTMELILNQVEALSGKTENTCLISRREREQLFAARTFLMDNLVEPPRLREVSLAVGLNEFKLKRGFKTLFGLGVCAFLQRERLRLAARWMMDPAVSIGSIAWDLGFSSPQHFSRAFRQCFGTPPRSFRKENHESGLYTFLP